MADFVIRNTLIVDGTGNPGFHGSVAVEGGQIVEVGAVTPKIQYGNRKPRVFRLNRDFAIINRLGFNNLGMKKVKSNLKKNIGYGTLGLNVGANKYSADRISDFIKGVFAAFGQRSSNFFTASTLVLVGSTPRS